MSRISDLFSRYKWYGVGAISLPLAIFALAFIVQLTSPEVSAQDKTISVLENPFTVDILVLDEVLGIWDGRKITFSTKNIPKAESLDLYLNGKPIDDLAIAYSLDDVGNITFITILPHKTVISADYTHSQEIEEG